MPNLSQAQIGGNEFFIQISKNLGYLKSYNYDLFSFYPTNRVPTHWAKILESIEIQDLTDRQPILVYKCPVTQKLFISDGQNRFLACKNSKRPIYAMVVINEPLKNGEASLSVLNSYQKNWSKADYLEYYKAKGFEAYKNLDIAVKETGFSISTLSKFWPSGDGNKLLAQFKNGQLTYPLAAIHRARIVKACFSACLKYKTPTTLIANQQALQTAIFSFLRAGATSKNLIAQLSKYGHLLCNCGGNAQYFSLLDHIYSFRKRAANKQSFRLTKAATKRSLIK